MGKIQKIKAFLDIESKIEIGDLIENQGKIYFKYHLDFIAKGIEISPFKMKLSNDILVPNEQHFEGLFGVFSDSIADGWGKLLLDRKLLSMGLNLSEISPIDRLAYLGKNAVGAITYLPEFENDYDRLKYLDLELIYNDITAVLRGNSEEVIDHLFQLGGSSGGARPKIVVGFNPTTEELCYGNPILPDGFEHWIIKFPASNDIEDIALIEFSYNQMARSAGIEVSDFRLFKSKKGTRFFGSKRFDRVNNQKLHLHSVCGLLHDNFRQSTLDYGHIMDCAFTLEKDFNAYSKVLRLATFNILAHNKDDHSKKFSFLMDKNGNWKFSPAYDLTFSYASFGMHNTTVAGESKNPTIAHLQELAKHFGIKNPNPIFDEVKNAISDFNILGNNLGITKDTMKLVNGSLRF